MLLPGLGQHSGTWRAGWCRQELPAEQVSQKQGSQLVESRERCLARALCLSRPLDEEGHVEHGLEQFLRMQERSVLAEELAVVGGDDDRRGVEQIVPAQPFEQPANLRIDECDLGIVLGNLVSVGSDAVLAERMAA